MHTIGQLVWGRAESVGPTFVAYGGKFRSKYRVILGVVCHPDPVVCTYLHRNLGISSAPQKLNRRNKLNKSQIGLGRYMVRFGARPISTNQADREFKGLRSGRDKAHIVFNRPKEMAMLSIIEDKDEEVDSPPMKYDAHNVSVSSSSENH